MTKLLLTLNKLFKQPLHPFNKEAGITYPEWQFKNGEKTIQYFTVKYSAEDMFKGKRVLDIGCGAGGKSLYYAKLGGNVTGLDIFDAYKPQAEEYAKKLGLSDKFTFVTGSACEMPFADCSFDTIIANDAIEHIDDPAAAIRECLRCLKQGGRLYINFPPYYHPMGHHLSDTIFIPWAHLFFSDDTLIDAYKQRIHGLPDYDARYNLRIGIRDDKECFTYLNKITVKRFKQLMKQLNISPDYYHEAPLRQFLAPLAKLPAAKEMFVKMVVAVIVKN